MTNIQELVAEAVEELEKRLRDELQEEFDRKLSVEIAKRDQIIQALSPDAVLRRVQEKLWIKGDVDLLKEIIAPDCPEPALTSARDSRECRVLHLSEQPVCTSHHDAVSKSVAAETASKPQDIELVASVEATAERELSKDAESTIETTKKRSRGLAAADSEIKALEYFSSTEEMQSAYEALVRKFKRLRMEKAGYGRRDGPFGLSFTMIKMLAEKLRNVTRKKRKLDYPALAKTELFRSFQGFPEKLQAHEEPILKMMRQALDEEQHLAELGFQGAAALFVPPALVHPLEFGSTALSRPTMTVNESLNVPATAERAWSDGGEAGEGDYCNDDDETEDEDLCEVAVFSSH